MTGKEGTLTVSNGEGTTEYKFLLELGDRPPAGQKKKHLKELKCNLDFFYCKMFNHCPLWRTPLCGGGLVFFLLLVGIGFFCFVCMHSLALVADDADPTNNPRAASDREAADRGDAGKEGVDPTPKKPTRPNLRLLPIGPTLSLRRRRFSSRLFFLSVYLVGFFFLECCSAEVLNLLAAT